MKRITLILLLIVLNSSLYSQDYPFKLYTSPLSAVDIFSRPFVTLGGELVVLKRIGIVGEYGYKYTDLKYFDTCYIKSSGYTYRFEIKYYKIGIMKIKNLKNYMSLEYRYIKDFHNEKLKYYVNSLRNEKLTDNFGVKENIYIGNIKYGMIIGLGKRLYFDVYFGIGLRYRDIKNINREFNWDLGNETASIDSYLDYFGLEEKSGFKPNPSLGFKFGIKL